MKKRPAPSSALISISPNSDEEQSPRNHEIYGRELECMLMDEEGESGQKKRRLSLEQVKALEKNFEVENKLDPDRKLKLARELGLQPRQVAVWFQNRRARWKTKQLERDFGLLKNNYDHLKLNCDSLQNDNQSLIKQIRELKSKLRDDNSENALIEPTKPEIVADQFSVPPATESQDFNYEGFDAGEGEEISLFPDFKDGLSDSDSSAILNEDYSPTAAGISSPGQNHQQSAAAATTALNYLQFQKGYQQNQMFPKMEEHNFFSGEEDCNFFSDEQPPTLHWWS